MIFMQNLDYMPFDKPWSIYLAGCYISYHVVLFPFNYNFSLQSIIRDQECFLDWVQIILGACRMSGCTQRFRTLNFLAYSQTPSPSSTTGIRLFAVCPVVYRVLSIEHTSNYLFAVCTHGKDKAHSKSILCRVLFFGIRHSKKFTVSFFHTAK